MIALVLAVAASVTGAQLLRQEPVGPLRLRAVAISGAPGMVQVHTDVPLGTAWVPGSSVLRLPSGQLTAPSPAVDSSRRWLADGVVPGRTPVERQMAERALHDLRLLTLPSGASLAGPDGIWAYAWPRDAAFVAAALAATGHWEDAMRVLRWTARDQRSDGTWSARTRPDGSGPPDDRPDQLDACGWFPWAVWFVAEELKGDGRTRAAEELLQELGPAAMLAARAIAARISPYGTLAKSHDYWENAVEGPTLGTAAALVAGMHATAHIARELDAVSPAADLAARLERALSREWPRAERYPGGRGGTDAAVAFLMPPFGRLESFVQFNDATLRLTHAEEKLRASSGGLRPGSEFPHPEVSWTPSTAAFALAYASLGERSKATALLDWLAAHRTRLGSLPERVDGQGQAVSAVPLSWTCATVLLALTALERQLPAP